MRTEHEGAMPLPATDEKMPRQHTSDPLRESSLVLPMAKMPRQSSDSSRMESPMGPPPEEKMPRRM